MSTAYAVPWSLDICSTQCSPVHRVGMHDIFHRDTQLYPQHNNSSLELTTTTEVWRSGRINDGMRSGWRTLRGSTLSSMTSAPPFLEWPRQEQRGSGRLRTGVGRLRSCLHKWGIAPSAACECGEVEQTVDHVVLHCPIHWSPCGAHGQTFLDDETIEWQLNTCPEI